MEQLTPIDEEPAEDNDEDQPITMIPKIPKIMHTAPSPTTENPPPTSNVTSTTTIHNDQTPKHDSNASENANNSKPPPSYAEVIVTEATVEKVNNHEKQSNPSVQNSATNNKEISQKESVL